MKDGIRGRGRRSIRLKGYDYARAGAYFVTIVTQDRARLFGELAENGMRLNDAGRVVQRIWDEIPTHYPGVDIDAFVVMPDHVHGIILLTGDGRAGPKAPLGQLPSTALPLQGHPPSTGLPSQGHPRGGCPNDAPLDDAPFNDAPLNTAPTPSPSGIGVPTVTGARTGGPRLTQERRDEPSLTRERRGQPGLTRECRGEPSLTRERRGRPCPTGTRKGGPPCPPAGPP